MYSPLVYLSVFVGGLLAAVQAWGTLGRRHRCDLKYIRRNWQNRDVYSSVSLRVFHDQ